MSGCGSAVFPVFPARWTAKPDWSGDAARSLDDSLDDSLERAAEAAPSALASPRRYASRFLANPSTGSSHWWALERKLGHGRTETNAAARFGPKTS